MNNYFNYQNDFSQEESQSEYQLLSKANSQYGNEEQKQTNAILESIDEEGMNEVCSQLPNPSVNIHRMYQRGGKMMSHRDRQVELISQEVDILEESQKVNSVNKSSYDYLNSVHTHNKSGMMGNNQNFKGNSIPNSNSLMSKNIQLKKEVNYQNFPQAQNVNVNPKIQYLNNLGNNSSNVTATKIKLAPANQNNNFSLINNSEANYEQKKPQTSQLCLHVRRTIEERLNVSLQLFEEKKQSLCAVFDKFRDKFIHSTHQMMNSLLAEAENVGDEDEEKNKLIDSRMDLLFNEMLKLLNDYYH